MARKKKQKEPEASAVYRRRETFARNRQVRHLIQGESARLSIGELERGCEIFGLTKGQFSLINLVEECLKQTGPADVNIATWTAAHAELKAAEAFLANGMIHSLRFLVDVSFPNRQPEYCRTLRETFGDDCIRATKTHAKFTTIRNEDWNLVIRTSMNLNENRRIEVFEISDDAGMAEYLETIVADFYSEPISWREADFEAWGGLKSDEKKLLKAQAAPKELEEVEGAPDWDGDFDL